MIILSFSEESALPQDDICKVTYAKLSKLLDKNQVNN
jgi:hypothetical protein